AVARLGHPNVIPIYEVGECDGQPYFSMEYASGGSLARRLAGKVLPARQAAQLVQTLAEAVHAAHRQGIVHRDLKPGNVLLIPASGRDQSHPELELAGFDLGQWVPKITDFGLAKWIDAGGQQPAGPTQTGAVLGTASYMAPEQADGKAREVGPATD